VVVVAGRRKNDALDGSAGTNSGADGSGTNVLVNIP
jgi:hypothetical protein